MSNNKTLEPDMNRRDKQPFLPETRSVGNMCACAACGAVARGVERMSASGPYAPKGWITRQIDMGGRDGLVYTCDRCQTLAVDGPQAREYYDQHNMRWMASSKTWVAERVPQEPAPVPETKKEESDMATNGAMTLKERTIGQAKDIGGAAALGLKLAATDEVGEMLVDILREFGKDSPIIEAFLADENGREIAKLLMAGVVQTTCVHTSMVPQAEFVKKAAELQMTASVETLAKPQMKNFRKAMAKLAMIGQRMAEIEGGNTSNEEEQEEQTTSASKKASASR